jgi:hypothetical protein
MDNLLAKSKLMGGKSGPLISKKAVIIDMSRKGEYTVEQVSCMWLST